MAIKTTAIKLPLGKLPLGNISILLKYQITEPKNIIIQLSHV